jgi:hypothetical protein
MVRPERTVSDRLTKIGTIKRESLKMVLRACRPTGTWLRPCMAKPSSALVSTSRSRCPGSVPDAMLAVSEKPEIGGRPILRDGGCAASSGRGRNSDRDEWQKKAP